MASVGLCSANDGLDAMAGNVRQHASWSPYDNNGGTVVAVAGSDYCIVAGSTRLSTGYSILSREHSSLHQLSPMCVLASSGFEGDRATLTKRLKTRAVMYQHSHKRPIGCEAMAQALSNTLYGKRFFPFYTFNILAGLDADGTGAVYSYDAVGSYERTGYAAQGTGNDLVQPLLDNQLRAASPLVLPKQPSVTALPVERALDIVRDALTAAGERDIYTGDSIEVWVITKDGIHKESTPLKKD